MQKASRTGDAAAQSQGPGTSVKVQKAKTSREKQELSLLHGKGDRAGRPYSTASLAQAQEPAS